MGYVWALSLFRNLYARDLRIQSIDEMSDGLGKS
jgi:hypothetical protein